MSYQRSCIINIDNTQNPYDLTLASIGSSQEGTFTPPLAVNDVVTQGTSATYTLSNDSIIHGADTVLSWTTGVSGMTVISMTISNSLDQTLYPNVAQMTVVTLPGGEAFYGTSFLSAGVGDNPVMARDFVAPPNTGTPLTVDVKIVSNAFQNVNPGGIFLPGIKNVVFLMLENRGFDHLMGQLYTETNVPSVFYPSGSNQPFAGLGDFPSFTNSLSDGDSVTAFALPFTENPTTPDPDPAEAFEYVHDQLYQNSVTGGADMLGFLYSYRKDAGITHLGSITDSGAEQIMGYYTDGILPVMHGLARQYAVCDEWFSSVPSQTYANRAFSVAGTSSGIVDNNGPISGFFNMRTMFNVLLDCGNTNWAIYTQDAYWTDSCFATFEFNAMDSPAAKSMVQPFQNFLDAAANGTLPAFSYLEPMWYGGEIGQKWNGNDYHPVANLLPGEVMLNQIYVALSSNQEQWNSTLFIVTFDEHGGTFDHVTPQGTVAPDAQTYAGDNGLTFDFSTLGVRVPTLLISPMIEQGMVFRSPDPGVYFDHTSFIRTILGWMGIDVSGGVMGARAAQAPDFSGVLSSSVVNPGAVFTPNDFTEEMMASYESNPLSDLQKQFTSGLSHSLSGDKKGGPEHIRIWKEMQSIKTMGELREYVMKAKAALAEKKKK